MSSSPVQVVDLFAGPGGLGEGFSSYSDESGMRFKIKVSAEMTSAARSTLRLRAFYRALKQEYPGLLDEYYRLVEGGELADLSVSAKEIWEEAGREALQLELGTEEGNERLDQALADLRDRHWVLIGGPPCQAYSLVGRSRNRGNPGYKAEDDHRHFLYREYLRIIQQRRPSVFVMENVKGILSSTVNGERIFPKILQDLAEPDRAVGQADSGLRYKIYSLVTDEVYESGMPEEAIEPSNYIIRAEDHGIPQARHRVILLGVSNDLDLTDLEHKLVRSRGPSVEQTIGQLPRLRSRITKCTDSPEAWASTVRQHLRELSKHSEIFGSEHKIKRFLAYYSDQTGYARLDVGGLRIPKKLGSKGVTGTHLDSWLLDENLSCWLNHEARGHMSSDLRRYAYAAVFAEVMKRSPKGSDDFCLPGLEPDHRSWKSGSFSDRFRVQLRDQPSTTITSHIAKDGHYFIHYDATQCRSLTVREAARLQTFPDDYFFLGTRTEQYHQVGNAVPPLLAFQIAELVARILQQSEVG